MKTIVAGSREGVSLQDVLSAMKNAPFKITAVISGTARGVDKMGEHIAFTNGLPIERYPANWKEYGKSAGYRRNVEMAEAADALVAVWNGISKGTKHMIAIAEKKKLKIHIYIVKS